MKGKTYLIIESVCVVGLLTFIAVLLAVRSGGTEKNVRELIAPVQKLSEVSAVTEQSFAAAVQTFQFDPDLAEGVLYYSNENIMDVSEVLIVKLNDRADAQTVRTCAEKRVADQSELFRDYAPDQYSLLQNSVIEISGNMVFYCTGANAAQVYEAFKKAL